jgi:hypothetical protein
MRPLGATHPRRCDAQLGIRDLGHWDCHPETWHVRRGQAGPVAGRLGSLVGMSAKAARRGCHHGDMCLVLNGVADIATALAGGDVQTGSIRRRQRVLQTRNRAQPLLESSATSTTVWDTIWSRPRQSRPVEGSFVTAFSRHPVPLKQVNKPYAIDGSCASAYRAGSCPICTGSRDIRRSAMPTR